MAKRIVHLTTPLSRLRLKHLDRSIHGIPKNVNTPPEGWIRTVRVALGMSQARLARRLGMTQQSVERLEQAESVGSITLERLRRAAEAMGGKLVYAIIPDSAPSFEDMVKQRAHVAAERLVERVERTMALEAQSRSPEARKQQVEDVARDLFQNLSREIWSLDESVADVTKLRPKLKLRSKPSEPI